MEVVESRTVPRVLAASVVAEAGTALLGGAVSTLVVSRTEPYGSYAVPTVVVVVVGGGTALVGSVVVVVVVLVVVGVDVVVGAGGAVVVVTGSLAVMVTVASGPRTKFGLIAHPPGSDRWSRKDSAASGSESSVIASMKLCSVSVVNEMVRRTVSKSWPPVAVPSTDDTSTRDGLTAPSRVTVTVIEPPSATSEGDALTMKA